jgi:hypothetical protein
MKIEQPGLFKDMSAADYFADCCPAPSLTQSVAKILLGQSPLHAHRAHPRLGGKVAEEEPEAYDKAKAIGNAAHAMMLGRGKQLAIADFPDWRSAEARTFKGKSYLSGLEPILQKHFDEARKMVDAAALQLSKFFPEIYDTLKDGAPEAVIACQENGIWLRSMVDMLSVDQKIVLDMKTTGKSVSPYATGRLMADAGWHVQAAFHERILDTIDPKNAGRRRHYFIAQENYEPYALTVNLIGEAAMTIGRKQVDYAIRLWSHCLTKNKWPAYPPKIITPELPAWSETGWLMREEEEADAMNSDFMMAG